MAFRTLLNLTNSGSGTLPSGQLGALKLITMVTNVNNSTYTLTVPINGGSTVTISFDTVGQTALLYMGNSIYNEGWYPLALYNSYSGSAPIIHAQKIFLSNTSNQIVAGTTNTTTLSFVAPASSRTVSIQDPGANADVVTTAGNQTIGGTKTFSTAISGNLTGNVTGNLTGNSTGTHTGNVSTNSIISAAGDIAINPGTGNVTTNASLVLGSGNTLKADNITSSTAATDLTLEGTNSQVNFDSSILKSGFLQDGTINICHNTDTSTILAFDLTNQTATKQTTIRTNSTANRVYDFPDVATCDIAMCAGNQTFAGTKTHSSAIPITPVTNQLVLGTTNTTTINAVAPSASRVISIQDPGANADFVTTAGNQSLAGVKTHTGSLTGTGGASITCSGSGTTCQVGDTSTASKAVALYKSSTGCVKFSDTVNAQNSTTTIPASNLINGIITTSGSGITLTYDSAANIVAAIPGCAVGDTIRFSIINTGAANTLAAGTNNTIVGSTTLAAGTSRHLNLRVTNVSGGTEATTIYG